MRHYVATLLVGYLSVISVKSFALDEVERATQNVITQWPVEQTNVLDLEEAERETFAVAKHLNYRLQNFRRNNDCRCCWLQKAHCICHGIEPMEDSRSLRSSLVENSIARIYVLMHHKEFCLVYDTAKLIPASFPVSCRVVVGGIGPAFQPSMQEMLDTLRHEGSSCMILFPSGEAKTYAEIQREIEIGSLSVPKNGWNIIVIDGTWDQARKLYARYLLPACAGKEAAELPLHVKLSDASLASLVVEDNDTSALRGMQLRRHPEKWREISTYGALRLMLSEMVPNNIDEWNRMGNYLESANAAARKQLGPLRFSSR
jgi:DTW domain-containing protein YfiP